MAVLTAKGISAVALALLERSLVLPRTVTNVPGSEFIGSNGDTITVRVPQPASASTQAGRGAALTATDVTEIPVDVTMSHLYHLKNISDQEASFDLENFAQQVTRVQAGAVAIGAEDELVSAMNALAPEGPGYQFDITPNAGVTQDDNTRAVLLAAREFLGANSAPASERYLAVSNDVASRLLHLLTPVNFAGDNSALRDAVIGRIYGFTVVECNGLTAGTAVAYHRSGFAFANRAPAIPRGATSSSVSASSGIAIRQVFQYDAGTAQDQSLLSTFAGAAAVYEDTPGTINKRWVKLETSEVV